MAIWGVSTPFGVANHSEAKRRGQSKFKITKDLFILENKFVTIKILKI